MRKTAYLVAGLGFGDEGKGATVDYLCRTEGARLVVRYNGGAQAAHTVRDASGREHVFSQWGSGTLIPGVETYLSPEVIINPISMLKEEAHLRELSVLDGWQRLNIDPLCLVVTPYHRALNRLQEAARAKKHGSCGMGIGAAYEMEQQGKTVLRAVTVKKYMKEAAKKLRQIRSEVMERVNFGPLETLKPGQPGWTPEVEEEVEFLIDQSNVELILSRWEEWAKLANLWPQDTWTSEKDTNFYNMISGANVIVFEGAQGMLLDRVYGTYPHNSWTDATYSEAYRLLKWAGRNHTVRRIGVLRSYMTRHGAGPFPTENKYLVVPEEKHNCSSNFQGKFRVGDFDAYAAAYSISCLGGIDELVINHMDRPAWSEKTGHGWQICIDHEPTMYDYRISQPDEFLGRIERYLGVPVTITAKGPRAEDRQRRSAWQSRLGRTPVLSRTPVVTARD